MMTNRSRTVLYTGVTNSLERRIWFHRNNTMKSFTKTYKVDRLVYYAQFDAPSDAIAREKEIKGWRREKKNQLVQTLNPKWRDLGLELFGTGSGKVTRREPLLQIVRFHQPVAGPAIHAAHDTGVTAGRQR
jgi:putative endonuclease